jgi:tellurite resistance protein
MAAQRIPLNIFSMALGLAGLGDSWLAAAEAGHTPETVGRVILAVSAAVWLVTVVCYLRYAITVRGALRADLTDTVAGPFASLVVITPMLLASGGLMPYSAGAAKVLTDIFLVLTVLFGGWISGQWIYAPADMDKMHPGYFLPTVAGGFVSAESAAEVGQQRLAEIMLGLGLVCWFLLGSMILGRLFFRPLPPAPLLPTLAIEVAPPAVASQAYFAINGGRLDAFAAALAGYGLLMVIVQIRLLPAFVRLKFSTSTWAFTFSWAAVASVTLTWIDDGAPDGHVVYTYLVLVAVTVLVGGIALRTAVAIAHRNLLPRPPAAAAR